MEDIDLGRDGTLTLPGVGQLGFVVGSIQNSLSYYASLYCLDTWFEPKYRRRNSGSVASASIWPWT